MGIIWPDGKRANLLDLDKTIEYTECDDTFAYEEDDGVEERPLLDLSIYIYITSKLLCLFIIISPFFPEVSKSLLLIKYWLPSR
jgi:hypothetical protein